MQTAAPTRLNDSGEEGVTRMLALGAFHYSRGQRTTWHAHYAWKVHVGLDAPVWLDSDTTVARGTSGARAILVPPNTPHATGAVGRSVAVFISPGSRGSAWRAAGRPTILEGSTARRLVEACHRHDPADRSAAGALVDAVASLSLVRTHSGPDARVRFALEALRLDPAIPLDTLARSARLSLDRLSRLVSNHTGMKLRRHVLWSRLLKVLGAPADSGNLTAAALAAGFADHGHMTRTFRAFLGRAPSEFRAPPDVIAPW